MTVGLKQGRLGAMLAAAIACCSCGFHHTKYENPITKDTQQPDKLLYDKAVKDLSKGRYEMARLTLNTLINTYDTSEYLAKAKLAIADSWYNEGGISGFAQAEQEYKDFELYFPTMPEAAEAQYKICKTHINQMGKPDRDPNQALRAEQECKQLVLQYPNSKFVPEAEQLLRDIDEDMAEGEMRAGNMYYAKGSRPAAANRYAGLVEQYPLYSRADEALWKEADAYLGMSARLRPKAVTALQKIVRDYPLGVWADPAKKKLHDLEAEVPEADPAAVARMKYEEENRTKTSKLHNMTGFLRPGPDTTMAAKTGSPAMSAPKQLVPVNVPDPGQTAAGGFNGDVTVAPAAGTPASTANITTATDPANVPKPDSAANSKDDGKKKNAKKNNKKNQKQDQKPDQTPAATPAAAPASAADASQTPAPASAPDQSASPKL
jgi:outer membrane protein assembly factor BamD